MFRAYLRSWSKNEKIYCLRAGKIFLSKLGGVACEKFFYKVQDLTPEEVQLIDRTVIEPAAAPLRAPLRQFLSFYSLAPKMKRDFAGSAHPAFLLVLEELIVNFAEDYHVEIENNLLLFLKSMLSGNSKFYSDDEQAAKFLYAISVQYTRTKQAREAALSLIGATVAGCDTSRVMSALSHIIAIILGHSLYIDRQRFSLMLIVNDTDTPFITADQPIINLHATFNGKPPEKLEFFYPLSPNRAMLLLEAADKRNDQPISAVSVNTYNVLMVQNSYEQVFSNSEAYLSSIRHLVSNEPGDHRIRT